MYYSKFMLAYKICIQDRVRYNLYFFRYNFFLFQLQTYFEKYKLSISKTIDVVTQLCKMSWNKNLRTEFGFQSKSWTEFDFQSKSLEWVLVQKSWMIKGFVMFSAKIHKADGPFEWQERLDSCENQAVFHWHHGNLFHSSHHKIRNHG